MKVDDICNAISRSTDPSQIKLVLLRYIGPFRPSGKVKPSEVVSEKIDDTAGYKDHSLSTSRNKKLMKKKTGFRLFGRGKKEQHEK